MTYNEVVRKLGGFNAVKYAGKGQQCHLATIEDSSLKDGYIELAYDPFPGDWRLTKHVVLGRTYFKEIGGKLQVTDE